MSTEELSLLEELLVAHYGRSFISDFYVLRDLLEVEFDLIISIEELENISKFDFDTDVEDLEITMRHCGVNY